MSLEDLDKPFRGFDEDETTRDFGIRVSRRIKQHDERVQELADNVSAFRAFFTGAKWALGIIGVLVTLMTGGVGWALKTLIDTQSDVHALTVEMHVRIDDQARRLEDLEREERTR